MRRIGAVLLLTLIIMTFLAAITVAFLYITITQTRGTGYDIASSRGLWLAEAGLQQAIYKLKNDALYRANPTTINANLGRGSYSVSVIKGATLYNVTAYDLASTGTVGVLSRKITQIVEVTKGGYGASGANIPEAFHYASYVRINASLSNSANGLISGDFAAGGKVSGLGDWTVNGTVKEKVNIDFPSVDFAAYKAMADHVINGNFTFLANQTYNGIYYITGNTTVEARVVINGGIVSEGAVNMRAANGVKINAGSGLPALISSNPIDISNASGVEVKGRGLIYTTQGINLQRAVDCYYQGTFIVGQDMSVSNTQNISIVFDPDILVNPPPNFTGYDLNLITIKPQKDWDEVFPAL